MAQASGRLDVAAIHQVIRSAVDERQRLQRAGADPAALEANRRAIAYWQARLSQALSDGRRPAGAR